MAFDSGDLNFSKVLFLLIIDIHKAAGINTSTYIALVEAYSDTLDSYYETLEVGDAQEKYDAVIGLANEYKGKKQAVEEVEKNLARAKFRALMKIADDMGLLFDRESIGEIK